MKAITRIILFFAFFMATDLTYVNYHCQANAEQNREKQSTLSMFDRIWMKIRSLSPRKNKITKESAVAGVKGAEKGSEELSPYWKGENPSTLNKEIDKYAIAEELMEQRQFAEAIVAFDNFIEELPLSQFVPNARFSKELCLLQTDQRDKAIDGLKTFIVDYPEHELTPDAKDLIASLNNSSAN